MMFRSYARVRKTAQPGIKAGLFPSATRLLIRLVTISISSERNQGNPQILPDQSWLLWGLLSFPTSQVIWVILLLLCIFRNPREVTRA